MSPRVCAASRLAGFVWVAQDLCMCCSSSSLLPPGELPLFLQVSFLGGKLPKSQTSSGMPIVHSLGPQGRVHAPLLCSTLHSCNITLNCNTPRRNAALACLVYSPTLPGKLKFSSCLLVCLHLETILLAPNIIFWFQNPSLAKHNF